VTARRRPPIQELIQAEHSCTPQLRDLVSRPSEYRIDQLEYVRRVAVLLGWMDKRHFSIPRMTSPKSTRVANTLKKILLLLISWLAPE
jgi:hypothetical protein